MKLATSNLSWRLSPIILITAVLTLFFTPLTSAQQPVPNKVTGATIYYVSPNGNDTDGLTWNTAFTSIWDAITAANFGDEIWVAAGSYIPGNAANVSFNLKSGVAMYGGFVGNEMQREQRDWFTNPTILTGDLGGDDANSNGIVLSPSDIVGTNSIHVVTAQAVTENTVLDGFVITAGNASASSGLNSRGGGFYCAGSGEGNQCNPTLSNIQFSGNYAGTGGAMYLDGNPTGESHPTLTNIIFSGNVADYGGAIYHAEQYQSTDNLKLTNVIFLENTASESGGAIYHYGSIMSLTNVTFYQNLAARGGAIANDIATDLIMTNVILWGNSATDLGMAIFNGYSHIELTSSLVQGGVNGPGIDNSEGGTITDVEGNIAGDPLFVDAANGNLRLQAESPAIDTGINVLNSAPTDLDGNPRIIHVRTDMGAYETPFYTLTVSVAGSGNGAVNATGIGCGGDCTESYAHGAQIILTAVPEPNNAFSGWSGGCSGTGDCELTITADTAVSATFSPEYRLYLPTVIKP